MEYLSLLIFIQCSISENDTWKNKIIWKGNDYIFAYELKLKHVIHIWYENSHILRSLDIRLFYIIKTENNSITLMGYIIHCTKSDKHNDPIIYVLVCIGPLYNIRYS